MLLWHIDPCIHPHTRMYSQWVIVPCKKHIRLHVKSLFREVLHSRSTYSTAELSCVKQPSPAKKKKRRKKLGGGRWGRKKKSYIPVLSA